MREYTADDGTLVKEWPEMCAALEPTGAPGPFMEGCPNDPQFCESMLFMGERWILGYCPDHRGQMDRYDDRE